MKSFQNERQARIFFRRKWLHPKMGQVKKSPQSPAPAPPPQRQYLTPSGIVALGPVEPENEPDERFAESTSIGEPTDTDISCFDFSRRNSNTDDAYRLKIELSDEDELIEIASFQSQASQDGTDREQDFVHDLNESEMGTWTGFDKYCICFKT